MIFDAIGMVGVILLIYAYYLLQMEKITIKEVKYSLLNALGSTLIIISLIFSFNLSSFMIESFWLLISLIGIVKHLKSRRHEKTG